MSDSNNSVIVLEALTVASSDVLGQKKSLTVETPCRFSNARGDLQEVQDYRAVAATAERAATGFRNALKTHFNTR